MSHIKKWKLLIIKKYKEDTLSICNLTQLSVKLFLTIIYRNKISYKNARLSFEKSFNRNLNKIRNNKVWCSVLTLKLHIITTHIFTNATLTNWSASHCSKRIEMRLNTRIIFNSWELNLTNTYIEDITPWNNLGDKIKKDNNRSQRSMPVWAWNYSLDHIFYSDIINMNIKWIIYKS